MTITYNSKYRTILSNFSKFLKFLSFSLQLIPLFSMPRVQKSYCSPTKLICPVEGCRKQCRTNSGLTQHLHAKHKEYQRETHPSVAAVNDCIILDSDLSSVSDLEMSIIPPDGDPAGAWDAFANGSESNHDSVGVDFEIPLPPDSPSRESEAMDSNVTYHPIINGL
jgi:hypothetical protein